MCTYAVWIFTHSFVPIFAFHLPVVCIYIVLSRFGIVECDTLLYVMFTGQLKIVLFKKKPITKAAPIKNPHVFAKVTTDSSMGPSMI